MQNIENDLKNVIIIKKNLKIFEANVLKLREDTRELLEQN